MKSCPTQVFLVFLLLSKECRSYNCTSNFVWPHHYNELRSSNIFDWNSPPHLTFRIFFFRFSFWIKKNRQWYTLPTFGYLTFLDIITKSWRREQPTLIKNCYHRRQCEIFDNYQPWGNGYNCIHLNKKYLS